MKAVKTKIPDVIIFEPEVFGDTRGYFFESFREDIFQKHAGPVWFVQENQSKSSYGVLRGLHYQKPPYTQGKLVRCISGEVLDVAVDIRWGSPTYGQHVAVKLNDKNLYQLWVPRGFAHGFAVLSETAVFSYKCDQYYSPKYEAGILFNDPALNIDWLIPENKLVLSEKDSKQPLFDTIMHFQFKEKLVLSR